MLLTILQVFTICCVLIYLNFKWSFKYWKKMNLPYIQPSIPFGNMENPFSRKYQIGLLVKHYYDEFKAHGHKHGGIYSFSSPAYIPVHPEYIKSILLKDFDHFVDRGWYHNEKADPLSAHLFAIGGQKWRNLRTKLTPTFTSGKIKMMFDLIVKSSDQMIDALNNSCKNGKITIDIKNVASNYTMDVIGSCAFGLDCNSFTNPDSEFTMHGRNIFAPQSKFKAIRHIFAVAKPKLGLLLGIKMLPEVSTNFFFNIVQNTINFREANNVHRNDMLQILMNLKNTEPNMQDSTVHDGKSLTIEEIAAQSLIFFLAGFETSSTTIAFCLYELSVHPVLQNNVREEIFRTMENHDGIITYESVTEMTLLEKVVDETLRKWPALSYITRCCTKDYIVPTTEVKIPKGTMIYIPIFGLHRDPDFYPEPDTFNPERFSKEKKKQMPQFTYMPFGEGPRLCIGLRFGLLQTKLGLINLLKNYHFSLNKDTKLPIKISPYGLILMSENIIWLNAEKISKI